MRLSLILLADERVLGPIDSMIFYKLLSFNSTMFVKNGKQSVKLFNSQPVEYIMAIRSGVG